MHGARHVRAFRFARSKGGDCGRASVALAATLAGFLIVTSDGTAVTACAQGISEAAATDCDPNAPILAGAGANGGASFLTADVRSARGADRPASWLAAADEGRIDLAAAKLAGGGLGFDPAFRDNGLLRVDLPRNDFADTGPGTMKLSLAGLDVDSDRSVAGGRAQWLAAEDERGRVLVEARLSWLFEYLQTDAAATPFFIPGEKAIFAVQGLDYGSNWALVGSGLRFELADGWSAFAGYDAQANSRQVFHIGSTGLGYTW